MTGRISAHPCCQNIKIGVNKALLWKSVLNQQRGDPGPTTYINSFIDRTDNRKQWSTPSCIFVRHRKRNVCILEYDASAPKGPMLPLQQCCCCCRKVSLRRGSFDRQGPSRGSIDVVVEKVSCVVGALTGKPPPVQTRVYVGCKFESRHGKISG